MARFKIYYDGEFVGEGETYKRSSNKKLAELMEARGFEIEVGGCRDLVKSKGEVNMDIKRRDGTGERRCYDTAKDMMEDAEKESKDPNTKTLMLHFPKMRIPGKRQAEKEANRD